MQAPANPPDERERLQALKSLGVLDTKCEERFDRYTRLARRLFDVPIALVSLVDDKRQWFKSRQGLDATETPRDISFCGHAILETKVFVVEDASDDERFFDNPLVVDDPSIRFYAGFPLTGSGGHQLGTLCIIDREPREFGPEDRQALTDMGAMVASELSAIELATMDELTQTSNRRGFDALARQALAACDRAEQPASVVLIDMNGFKGINDTYGHEEGDRALIEFASLMRRTFRESDIVARIGGDEFAALLTNACPAYAYLAVQRLRAAVAERNERPGHDYDLAFSAGVAGAEDRGARCVDALLREADERMYAQKREQADAA